MACLNVELISTSNAMFVNDRMVAQWLKRQTWVQNVSGLSPPVMLPLRYTERGDG